ncbi:protein MIZU-KUSSEI 1-like [Zingiber officinale]|uniref:Protein MIZU-KUSSEI 1 n=1 Tax=Zingiber officinale TaxID=94328 RepID=A0A8J5FV02_ZINOF|nr:protein MIZU-KUSSEI 1-like [Zingiber officinale]KAG6495465.1 hypothetical protein ZIOFF_043290 [Zingiber officinale]
MRSSITMGRHFQWRMKLKKKSSKEEIASGEDLQDEEKSALSFSGSSSYPTNQEESKKRISSAAETAVSRIRSLLTAAATSRRNRQPAFVIGTLYGHRHGHVRFAFQTDTKAACPVMLVELATPTAALVHEMASGLVRIALECERKPADAGKAERTLVEEPVWKAYVNGKKCGYAVRRECGPMDWKVMRAVEPVSMGAGVIPGDGDGTDKDVMYMRARFERVVGSRDSEAFYMMNPDGNGGPELSIYFLRV